MGVHINGMEMPKEPDEMIEIAIFGDGKVIQTGESWRNLESGKCYYTPTTPEKFFNAVPVPPHGDLIDRDALRASFKESIKECHKWADEVEKDTMMYARISQSLGTFVECSLRAKAAPTIIEAEEEKV